MIKFGDMITFDTTTCEFKKEAVDRDRSICIYNSSANLCENTIIALVRKDGSYVVL